MLLVCAGCHHRWNLAPGAPRIATCPSCHKANRRSGAVRGWLRRRAAGLPERSEPEGGVTLQEPLEKLISDVDRASARVAEILKSLSVPR
jgi:hypothetical protein